MKIVVYIPDLSEKNHLDLISHKTRELEASFSWEVTTDRGYFESALGAYKVECVEAGSSEDSSSDLRWPLPSIIMNPKNKSLKAKVWSDIQEKLFPALAKEVFKTSSLSIKDSELQKLLSLMVDSKASFTMTTSSGLKIGVNRDTGVDKSLSTADVASLLAGAWLFGAKLIEL